MCRRFSTARVNVEAEFTQGATLHPAFDPASPIAVHAPRDAPPQTDASLGGDADAAGQHFGLVPVGGPHGATSAVAF